MKLQLLALILALSFPFSALAANLTCVVPAAEVSAATATCEALRVALRVTTADWSNNECATEMLRRGLRGLRRVELNRSGQQTARDSLNTGLSLFDTNFPIQVTTTACGDATVDADFGEECDNGTNDGTLCNFDCTLP